MLTCISVLAAIYDSPIIPTNQNKVIFREHVCTYMAVDFQNSLQHLMGCSFGTEYIANGNDFMHCL